MNLHKCLYLVAAMSLASILVACAGGSNGETDSGTSQDTSTPEERSAVVEITPVDSGAAGNGAKKPRIVIADSLESLRDVAGITPPESTSEPNTDSTYIAALWGEKRTGGYTIKVESANLSGEAVTVTLRLEEPPEGAMVAQALTYPYSVVALSDVDVATTEFVFEDQGGERLDWPVRNLSDS